MIGGWPDVQVTLPFMKSVLDAAGTKEAKRTIKLTSLGWEVKVLA